jgi:hypothetical protein
MKMRTLFLLGAGVIFSFTQINGQSWSKGSVTLANKHVLTGDISVDTQYDLILVRSGDLVDVFPAHRINSSRLYDSKKDINRRYISLKDPINPRMSKLFEIVISGEIFVLRREVSQFSTTIEHEALGFEYYVLFENELIALKQFNPKVYPKLKESEVAVASFIKQHQLSPNNEANAVQIIQYYNKQVVSAEVVKK